MINLEHYYNKLKSPTFQFKDETDRRKKLGMEVLSVAMKRHGGFGQGLAPQAELRINGELVDLETILSYIRDNEEERVRKAVILALEELGNDIAHDIQTQFQKAESKFDPIIKEIKENIEWELESEYMKKQRRKHICWFLERYGDMVESTFKNAANSAEILAVQRAHKLKPEMLDADDR